MNSFNQLNRRLRTMKELDKLIDEFREAYVDAPLYGGYSRTLKRKIDSKLLVKLKLSQYLLMSYKS